MNMEKAYGVIFDLDGVLIDSEGLYYRAYSEALKPYGVAVSREEYEQYWIAQGNGPEYIVEKHNLPISPDELRQLRSPVYLQLLESEVKLMPYVEEALTRLFPHFSLTVATNSNREHLDAVLRRMNIAHFFPMTVARQDYQQAKPQPDAFLTAAAKLGLTPTQYYLDRRLCRARELLLQTDMPITGITLACGFRSIAYFSKAYRAMFGRSPSHYRRDSTRSVSPAAAKS